MKAEKKEWIPDKASGPGRDKPAPGHRPAMSTFTFLKSNWPDLYATASEAEQNVNSSSRGFSGDDGASRIVHLLQAIEMRAAA